MLIPSSSSNTSTATYDQLLPSNPTTITPNPQNAFLNAVENLWSIFGAVPILACFVASLPITSSQTTRERDTLMFAGIGAILAILRLLYALIFPRGFLIRGTDLSSFHAWVQLVCTCTLFLLFCQGVFNNASNRKKANSTLLSSIETYSEHAYTLPLLAACRLAYASFGMDARAAGSSQKKTRTFLLYMDLVLGFTCVLVFAMLLAFGIAGVDDSHSTGFSQGNTIARFLQWVLFLQLAFTHLCQDDFIVFDRRADCLLRGGTLVLRCIAFHLQLPSGTTQKLPAFDYYTLKMWAARTSHDASSASSMLLWMWEELQVVLLRMWAALLACR